MTPQEKVISVVVPVFDEVESLARLRAELDDVSRDLGADLEIIFVDDGSSDGSWDEITRLAEEDPRVQGVRFRRNFGKAAALKAGFRRATGKFVLTLDADLQDDPREIPAFLAKLEKGFDLVSGWKRIRHDPWHKVLPSRVFNWLVSRLTGVRLHDHNCGMKGYRAEVPPELRLYGEMHRFIPVLANARGFRVGELEIRHRARSHGRSKYGVERFAKGFLDLLTVRFLTGFGQRPQHLLGSLGLALFGLGSTGLVYLACLWLAARLRPDWEILPLSQRPAVIYSVAALLLGAQLLSIGLLAELITAFHGRESDTYSIAEETTKAGARLETPAR